MRLLIVASGARQWTDAAALQRRDAASPPRVARWGDLGRVSSGGPTTDSDGPGSDAGGVPMGAWRGPRSRQERGHMRWSTALGAGSTKRLRG
jgi:hypothetical protein